MFASSCRANHRNFCYYRTADTQQAKQLQGVWYTSYCCAQHCNTSDEGSAICNAQYNTHTTNIIWRRHLHTLSAKDTSNDPYSLWNPYGLQDASQEILLSAVSLRDIPTKRRNSTLNCIKTADYSQSKSDQISCKLEVGHARAHAPTSFERW